MNTSTATQYDIVYNLYPFDKYLTLPNAHIAPRKPSGELLYIQHRATTETIGGFGLELTPLRQELFRLIEQLQEKALEEKFNAKNKRRIPLAQLMADKKIKEAIQDYVHRELDKLLNLLSEHRLPLCWNIERKVLVEDLRIHYPDTELTPRFFFKRNTKDIRYRFWFEEDGKIREIRNNDVLPLTNEPAWLLFNNRLHKVPDINGLMVIPFQEKPEVFIPYKHIKIYFQQFIRKVAGRADIEAEGFEIIQHDRLLACRLEAVHDFFRKQWVLTVKFAYPKVYFEWKSKQLQRTMLEFDGEEDVIIHRISRNTAAETSFLNKLKALGLQENGSYFLPEGDTNADEFYLLEWLAQHRIALQEAGFTVLSPHINQQEISLRQPHLETNISKERDWFDVHIQVQIGDEWIPFKKLVPYIRNENRLYPLSNGQFFIIPLEWFNRYRNIARFGKNSKESLRLEKSQFMLLQDIAPEETDLSTTENLAELADFELSPLLQATLRPYQLEGVRWMVNLYQQDLGACLADDMGLGKTLQTLAVLLHAKEQRVGQSKEQLTAATNGFGQLDLFSNGDQTGDFIPLNALIILPASLVFNWEQEIKKFAPKLGVYKYVGNRQKDIRILKRYDVLLTTYHTARQDVEILEQLEFEYIVLDESQQIKNKNSQIFKAINRLQARHKISLSGTPIENSLADLWAQMQFINPNLLGSFRFFQQEYITPIEKYKDEAKKDHLKTMVQPYLLRRTKEEVARELPELNQQRFYSEMSSPQHKLYEKEKSAARNYLLENFEGGSMEYHSLVVKTLLRLRQIACHPVLYQKDYANDSGKFTDILEYFDVLRRSNRKVLAFSNFTTHLELFKTHFDESGYRYAWLTGETLQAQRQAAVEQFQNDEAVQTFFISMKAGGTGLNLTAADYVCILDPWWNPATEQQAIARAHRIGQQKPVIAVKFITKNTIEEKIVQLQEQKAQLAEDIIENRSTTKFSRSDIEFLFA